MKRLLIILLLMSVIGINYSQTLKLSYDFEKPIIQSDISGFSEIIYTNCQNLGSEGSPCIPIYAADILLAPNSEIQTVKIISQEYYQDKLNIKIKPAGKQFPLSKSDKNYKISPDKVIYNSNNIYPEKKLSNISTHFLTGHSIGSFTLCPVEYTPAQNKVRFIKTIEIEITLKNTEKALKASNFLKTNNIIHKRIINIVDNPNSLNNYSYTKDFSEYDILLISNETLLPEFQDYVDFKISTGYIVATETTENIYLNYSGSDDQEKIRNCIIDYYQNYGISYVILGGDADPANAVVPYRGLYSNTDYGTSDNDISADIYYSNLDGNWNTDGDGLWGEPGEDDLYAEVAIGRICVDNALEIENSTHKLYMYQNEPVIEDIEKALMIGELLWTGIWGKMYKTQIETGGTFNGYTTTGISDNFNIEQLYEQDGNWTASQLYSQFNTTGINLLNHLGHCNVTYCMTINNPDINSTNFQNDGISKGYVIEYSQGCYCGSFDNRSSGGTHGSTDCFSEVMCGFENGNVAFISNSRYGWGDTNGTNGSSQYYDREFFDAIFGEDITQIGYTNSDSKEDNIAYLNFGANRYCMYELTLFGDPSMDIWTETPSDMNITYNSALSIGTDQITFLTETPFARIGLMQNGELIGRAVADETGTAVVDLFDPVTTTEDINVSIIAHNKNRHLGTITVFSDQAYVVYNSHVINDASGNNNGLPDYNESVYLTLAMRNVGNVATSDVTVTLSASDTYITITDATENYGDFSAEQTIELTDAFAFDIADNVPDAHTVLFTLTAVSGVDEWVSNFSIILNAPVFEVDFDAINDNSSEVTFLSNPITEISLNDNYVYDISVEANAGNGNGLLDAGETVSISVNTSNNGHAASTPATITLTTTNPEYVTVNTNQVSLGVIEVGQTLPAEFSITVDESTPVGTVVELIFTLVSGEYSEIISVNLAVGLQIEDFETGDFSSYPWTMSGSADWLIDTDAHAGTYSAKSGNIGDNQDSEMSVTIDVASDGEITFWSKVSSEGSWDYLRFYIDGSQQDQWSGTVGWGEHTYSITAGVHTLKWAFEKDGSVSNGSDCGWVDDITFPGHTSTKGMKLITITAPTLPTWLSLTDNGDGTGVLSGMSPSEQGLHDVVLQAQGSGDSVSQEFTINVGGVSVGDIKGSISIFPNPNNGLFFIDLQSLFDIAEIVIQDINGKMISQTKTNSRVYEADLTNYAKGVYFVKISSGKEIYNGKIILK